MSDEATLKDVTASPNPGDAAAAQEPAKAAPAKAPEPVVDAAKLADAEAAEVGRILLDSGYTKDQINDVIQAPQALSSLRALINGNPQEFYNLLQRTAPDAEEKMLEAATDRYLQRYGKREQPTKADGADGKGANAELMSKVEALEAEVNQFRTKQEQAQAAAAMAQVQARYNGRVDDLFSLEGVKNLHLTKSEQSAMRAQLDKELAADQTVVQRISNGNFVDVPRRFQSIVEGWAADRKAAAEADKADRDRAKAGASPEFLGGPNPFLGDIPKDTFDSWDATEAALAKALERTAGR